MATVNEISKQMNTGIQSPDDDSLLMGHLDELYNEYKRVRPKNINFITWLEKYFDFPAGNYEGYSKNEYIAAAKKNAQKYPVVNGVTNGERTQTVENTSQTPEESATPTEEMPKTGTGYIENADKKTTYDNGQVTTENKKPQTVNEITSNMAQEEPGVDTVATPDNTQNATTETPTSTEEESNYTNEADQDSNLEAKNQEETVDNTAATTTTENTPPEESTVEEPVATTTSSNTTNTNAPRRNVSTASTQTSTTPTRSVPTTTQEQPAEMLNRSGRYEAEQAPAIRPVDRGRFDYIRNNGWGSNSSILTRMGYSQDEIRRILDSSGAVRPEYFNY